MTHRALTDISDQNEHNAYPVPKCPKQSTDGAEFANLFHIGSIKVTRRQPHQAKAEPSVS